MADERKYYRVTTDLYHLKLPSPMDYGYESESDFREAVNKLARFWYDRMGYSVDDRNGFLRIRFTDTPGGMPDEAWMPKFLLIPIPPPPAEEKEEEDEMIRELDDILGFD